MNSNTLACNSSTERKLPLFSSLRTKMLNHISIWFNHELCLGVFGSVMKDDLVAAIAQECCSRHPIVQDPALAFLSQLHLLQSRCPGYQTHQRLGAMGVKVVHHKVPF